MLTFSYFSTLFSDKYGECVTCYVVTNDNQWGGRASFVRS